MDNYIDGFNELTLEQKYDQLVGVYQVMKQYNRTDGWMRWDGDKVRFYDSEVDGGTFVTFDWIKFWIAAFN